MSASETLYSFAVATPQYLERGREQVVKMPAYRNGALSAPSSGTYSLYDASNAAVVSAQAVTVSSSVAQYTITAATLPATLTLGEGWREEWSLVMADSTTRTVRRDAALCRRLLYPVVSLVHLQEYHPDLADILPSSDANAQGYLDGAWVLIANRLVARGNRINLIISPWSLKEVHELLALHRIYNDAAQAAGDGRYAQLAEQYKRAFDTAWDSLSFQYDRDEDGVVDDPDQREAGEAVISLNIPPSWGWGY